MYKLKSRRVSLGLSQQELAKKLGITSVWLNKIENKKKQSPEMEAKITNILEQIEREKYGISIPTLS